mgnify:CR=1 FL=1
MSGPDYVILDETFTFDPDTGIWTIGAKIRNGVIEPGFSAIYRCRVCPCPESSHDERGWCQLHGAPCEYERQHGEL